MALKYRLFIGNTCIEEKRNVRNHSILQSVACDSWCVSWRIIKFRLCSIFTVQKALDIKTIKKIQTAPFSSKYYCAQHRSLRFGIGSKRFLNSVHLLSKCCHCCSFTLPVLKTLCQGGSTFSHLREQHAHTNRVGKSETGVKLLIKFCQLIDFRLLLLFVMLKSCRRMRLLLGRQFSCVRLYVLCFR